MNRRLASFATTLVLVLAGTAVAQPQTQPTPPAKAAPPAAGAPAPVAPATSASAEVTAAKKVEKREPVDEGTSFGKGETVWIWSRVLGANGTTVKHVWKRDGKAIWTASLKIGSAKWTTSSRRTLKTPGSYAVDVVGQDGATLGTVEFTVQ